MTEQEISSAYTAAAVGRIRLRQGACFAVLAAAMALLAALPGRAGAWTTDRCPEIPHVGGIPPWGFHTGAPITGATGSYARGHGDISLTANTVSGVICQVDRVRGAPDRVITMSVEHHLVSHSHFARRRWCSTVIVMTRSGSPRTR